ncbi:MAG: Jag N-terminal domain-containing protein [Chloroflexi bacterium]|nr:Jag N-terminal domain-containing protein [Chloroflexota bacterium]
MGENRTTLEIIAPSIEEAIAKGVEELGLPEEALDVEVLDEGSRGLFGLGSRQARVRLSIRTDEDEEQPAPARVAEPAAEKRPARQAAPIQIEEDEILQVAEVVVGELLLKMRVRAGVKAHFGEADDEKSRRPLLVDVSGRDLSILIGRQAETLNALQYIASLIVSKEIGQQLTLVIDVQGYRLRREQQIRQLAERMADQAIKTGRKQVLEPMPASERRIVHIALRNSPDVTTESIGVEPRRKVTIVPKQG